MPANPHEMGLFLYPVFFALQLLTDHFVKLGGNRAAFGRLLLPAGKEKVRIHAGMRDFGGYGKMGKVSTQKGHMVLKRRKNSHCYFYLRPANYSRQSGGITTRNPWRRLPESQEGLRFLAA